MNNRHFYMDLHIHIGRTRSGKPVKITGSKQLTLTNILKEAGKRKGLDIIGIIDCHVPEVLEELKEMIALGEATPLAGGGLKCGEVTLFLGTEMEICDEHSQGPFHVLCYLPCIEQMERFSFWMSNYQKNIHLSSQRSYVQGKTLQHKVKELDGLFIPAHIFTPFKSLYGKAVKRSLTEILDPELIDAVELGLSTDTSMAEQIGELAPYPFLTNSDAHSLSKIGREYQLISMAEADFKHFKLMLAGEENQGILANFGLNPKLGKYYLEVSRRFKQLVATQPYTNHQYPKRPEYIHQIPLEYIPGLGSKGRERLIDLFGTEMDVIHKATRKELEAVLPTNVVEQIIRARVGRIIIKKGGKGVYGKLS